MMTTTPITTSLIRRTRPMSVFVVACWFLIGGDALAGAGVGLLTITSRTEDILPAPVSDIRHSAEASLDLAFAARGCALASPEETLELQHRWRVRDGRVISLGFLEDAASTLGADCLAVVQVMIAPSDLFFAGRIIETGTGRLLDAGTIDPVPWSDATWAQDLDTGLALLAASLDTEPGPAIAGLQPLIVLPVQSRGFALHDTETATHTLLETVLDQDGVTMTDPAVMNARLIAAGHDPRRLGHDAMLTLAETEGAEVMVVAEAISYASEVSRGGTLFDEGFQSAAPASLPSHSYFVRIVDLETGLLRSSAIRYFDSQPRSGWFGFVHNRTSRDVLGTSARSIWRDIGFHTEASDEQATGSSRTARVDDAPDRSDAVDRQFGRRHATRNDGPGHRQR